MRRFALFLALALLLPAASVSARAEESKDPRAVYIRSNYTKFEHRIAMRDGTRLFTAVYVPNDTSKTYPILMQRTPYTVGPYGADRYKGRLGPTARYEKEGYIFVFQDVRGRFMSEGDFINMRPHNAQKSGAQFDESTDTYDTIDWLIKNVQGHNGRVGQWGVSYPGFYSSAGMIDSHPALKAVSPQAPIADWFWDDMHHHGAFVLPLSFHFFSSFGQARPELTTEWPNRFEMDTPDGYDFFLRMGTTKRANSKDFLDGKIEFWNEMSKHPNYDEFWKSRNILPHLKNIKAAVLVVGGWYDTEDLYGPLETYRSIEEKNPGIQNTLVMGPWSHGQWRGAGDKLGDASFGFKTGDWYRDAIEWNFFDQHLKDRDHPQPDEAVVFETGANRWRRFDAWPPAGVKRQGLHFQSAGRLTFAPCPDADGTSDAYISDPSKPVPYTADITSGWSKGYMTEDQRFAARRPDVLVYQTDVLDEDLTLAGHIQADLWVSTTGTASDFVVKVIDVWPGEVPGHDKKSKSDNPGSQQLLIRADVIRGRFRDSYEHPKPFESGKPTRVSFKLSDVLHTFKRGHRVMIQVQSTWFPFIDRNPQKYVPNIFEAEASDYITVTNRLYHSKAHPSHIEVGVLK